MVVVDEAIELGEEAAFLAAEGGLLECFQSVGLAAEVVQSDSAQQMRRARIFKLVCGQQSSCSLVHDDPVFDLGSELRAP